MAVNTRVIQESFDADEALKQTASLTDTETMKLYEERMIVDKDRIKTGEVAIDKHIESETTRISMPIEKEHIVIERVPTSGETVATDNVDAFQNNETVRMEVYEETPDIHKEAFLREEVSIRKEVTQEMLNEEATLRREELDIDTQGSPVIDNRSNQTETLRR